jgi:hypothetical protein
MGVYQIRWAIDGKPQIIHRVNGDDESGILYIGESDNLKKRISDLWRGISTGHGHTAGWTYDYYGFSKKFKLEHLEVQWIDSEDAELEPELLGNYVEKYLDKPPLNISIPRY